MKELTTTRQLRHDIYGYSDGALELIYNSDWEKMGVKSRKQKKVYVLTPEEIRRIKGEDVRLSGVNSIGLRNMFIKVLKRKGYVKTKRVPLTYTYIPSEERIEIIDGKKYRVTRERLT